MNARKEHSNATWTAYGGEMVFILPDRSCRTLPAHRIDHPLTMCSILDDAAKLTPFERRTVICMLTEFEMGQMYPRVNRGEDNDDSELTKS